MDQSALSPWAAKAVLPRGEPLPPDTSADVCVIGAGIAGLSAALMLQRLGRSVAVLDDGRPGSGETARSSAHLSSAIDDGFAHVEEVRGSDEARLAYESHAAAIDLIEGLVRKERIDCGFRRVDGFLFAAPGRPADELARELAAAARAGARVEEVERAPIPALDVGPCLRFRDQAQMDPLAYLYGLLAAFLRGGGRLFAGHAVSVRDGDPAVVEIGGGRTLAARAVVVATNSPFTTLVAMHTKQAPYRTFVVAAECPRGTFPQVLLWDTGHPYHYVRVEPAARPDEPDLLLVGGEDHKTGQADDADERYERLEQWMRPRFPAAGQVRHRWSGQVLETLDGLAYIGREPGASNVYLATGDSGMGLTHGTIAAMLLSDLIVGRENPWTHLYAPDRKPLRAAGDFLRENLNVAAQFADYVKPGEARSSLYIAPGTGAVVLRGLHRVAAYRDPEGNLHERSAICTHLGCVVHFNSAETSWDCPCHGSRFGIDGRVLNGPASKPLPGAWHHAASTSDAAG